MAGFLRTLICIQNLNFPLLHQKEKEKHAVMASEPQNPTTTPASPSYSYWADPSTKSLWDTARDRLAAGEPLAPPRRIPVIVNDESVLPLLRQIAGLTVYPKLQKVQKLSSNQKETGQEVYIRLLSDEALFRLDGYINESEECLVRLDGTPRYASKFDEKLKVRALFNARFY